MAIVISAENKELQAEEIRQLVGNQRDSYPTLAGRLLFVKVGSDDRPATPDDIKDMEVLVARALHGIDCRVIVTHHALTTEII